MKINKLNIKQVENAKPYQAGTLRTSGKKKGEPYQGGEPKRYGDGGGLHLIVEGQPESLHRKWVFRFTLHGKPAEMGLGGSIVPLAVARKKAAAARELVALGINPVEEKRSARAAKPSKKTFGQCAEALIKAKQGEWRSLKHRQQWSVTLKTYAAPLWSLPVDQVDTEAVLAVLQPLWQRATETASRLRGRIEAVLDYAKAHGWRSGENPAAWRGHLALILPKRGKLSRGHHAAMSYADVPAFLEELRETGSIHALALEFLILTATRSGEVLGARWDEIDLEARVWTIPAGRMKAGVAHRVPLSGAAVAIVERLAAIRTGDFIFAGQGRNGRLSNNAFAELVPGGATVHGFRSAFRDWCGNETNFPREIAEAALAHRTGDATEAAYRRSDALEKRRALMEAWAGFCGAEAGGNVVPLRQAV
jgi:integrase